MKRGTEDLDFFIGDEAIAASGGPGIIAPTRPYLVVVYTPRVVHLRDFGADTHIRSQAMASITRFDMVRSRIG